VRAALTTAVRRLREDMGRTDRLLIALPAFRVGLGGEPASTAALGARPGGDGARMSSANWKNVGCSVRDLRTRCTVSSSKRGAQILRPTAVDAARYRPWKNRCCPASACCSSAPDCRAAPGCRTGVN